MTKSKAPLRQEEENTSNCFMMCHRKLIQRLSTNIHSMLYRVDYLPPTILVVGLNTQVVVEKVWVDCHDTNLVSLLPKKGGGEG